jgi:lactate dehydrogenase-like 2-hydroxyacid dehydrogenase
VTRGVAYVQAGRWGREGQMPLARSCQNKLAGIVGLGRIGKAVARRLAACGMRILYHGRNQQPAMPYTYYNDLHAMARDSDILVLCCPATEATIGLVDANVLRELGPQGILINVSRGSVVDETALIAALGSQTIAGAGLDVCVNEPNPNPALVAFDNVTLLPHLGAATIETRVATFDTMIANIQCHFSGLPLPNRYAPA